MTVFLDAQSELPALNLPQVPAHQVEEDHGFSSIHFVGCRSRPVSQASSLGTAELLPSLHDPHKPPDPVDLLSVGIAELLEAGHQFIRRFSRMLNIFLNLVEESIQFCVDFK